MRLCLALLISVSFTACHSASNDSGPVGTATARITQVPNGVACVSITVVGERTVMHSSDVVAGQPALLHLDDLPVGLDAFSAAAFAMPCASINGVQPSWATAQPFYASVSQGAVTPLTLTLEPTGGAVIGIEFGDGGPPADLSPCPGCIDGGDVDMVYVPWDMAYTPADLAF